MNNDKLYKATSETLSDYFHCSVKPEVVPNGTEIKAERIKLYSQTRDLLWSGHSFIKGNNYTLVSNTEPENEEGTEGGLGIRYFEDYSTIRCRRCNALGHMSFTCSSTNSCTRICIYCNSHNHDQFDCPNRMCFRCNKRGHKIQQCPERKVELCPRCNNPGHRENDCIIHPKEIKEESLKQAVCMTCGELGHIACKLKAPEILPWDKDVALCVDSIEVLNEKYKKRREESENIQCCYCGGIHRPSRCTNKPEVNPQSTEAIRSRIRQRENDDNQYSHRRSSSRERNNHKNHYRKHKDSSRHPRRSRSRSHERNRKHHDH